LSDGVVDVIDGDSPDALFLCQLTGLYDVSIAFERRRVLSLPVRPPWG